MSTATKIYPHTLYAGVILQSKVHYNTLTCYGYIEWTKPLSLRKS